MKTMSLHLLASTLVLCSSTAFGMDNKKVTKAAAKRAKQNFIRTQNRVDLSKKSLEEKKDILETQYNRAHKVHTVDDSWGMQSAVLKTDLAIVKTQIAEKELAETEQKTHLLFKENKTLAVQNALLQKEIEELRAQQAHNTAKFDFMETLLNAYNQDESTPQKETATTQNSVAQDLQEVVDTVKEVAQTITGQQTSTTPTTDGQQKKDGDCTIL